MSQPRGRRPQITRRDQARSVGRAWRAAGRLSPTRGTVDEFVAAVAKHRDRHIAVLPCPLAADTPSGLWLVYPDVDYILHDENLTKEHRDVVVCHEVAHMLLGHKPRDGQFDTSAIAPTIAPEVAARFFTRHGYEDDIEAGAETLATLLATALTARADAVRAVRARTGDNVSARLR